MPMLFSALRRPLPLALAVAGLTALLCVPARAASPASNVQTLATLGSLTVGTAPRGELFPATDGNVYGTASSGGAAGYGSVFRIGGDGAVTAVFSFGSAAEQGISPYAGVVEGPDGALYGVTYFGGTRSDGAIFKLTKAGTYTQLHSFDGRDRGAFYPYGGLALGPDGKLYGTTLRGGQTDQGTVFSIATDGTGYTVLASFKGSDGANPEGTLTVGRDGTLWGTTLIGGANDRGTVFKMTPGGTITVVHSFAALGAFNASGIGTNAAGANPRAGLSLGPDGNLYGTTYQGGSGGYGTVFRLTPGGTLTTLHTFAGAPRDGAAPLGIVRLGADGSLYGTTERGGASSAGVAWRISPTGVYSVLHSFSSLPLDGATSYNSVLPWNGGLLGTTFTDSSFGGGIVYKLQLPEAGNPLPIDLQLSPDSLTLGASATLSWSAPNQASCTTAGAWSDTVSTSGTKVQTPASVGIYNYALSCTDGVGVTRHAFAQLLVSAPPAQSVDGGATGSAGALGWWSMAMLAGVAGYRFRRRFKPA